MTSNHQSPIHYLYKLMTRRTILYYKPGGKLCFFFIEDLNA